MLSPEKDLGKWLIKPSLKKTKEVGRSERFKQTHQRSEEKKENLKLRKYLQTPFLTQHL